MDALEHLGQLARKDDFPRRRPAPPAGRPPFPRCGAAPRKTPGCRAAPCSGSSAVRRCAGLGRQKAVKEEMRRIQTCSRKRADGGAGAGQRHHRTVPPARTARTRIAPGSLTPGVPASDTSATVLPACSAAMILGAATCSLCSCNAISLAEMPKWPSKCEVLRVSSAATMCADFNISSARKVMSRKFPIGVATTYNVPTSFIPWP